MSGMNSFRDVVAERFCDGIFNALSKYVESNPDRLDSNSNYVESPDEATLSDIDIKFVDITGSEGTELVFDVLVSAEIEIAETIMRNRETDGIEQWFRISCSAELDDGLRNFDISGIEIYNQCRGSNQNRLSEYLVPIIRKEQLDDVAEAFLEKYYPEALAMPTAVPAHEVAKRMGLVVREAHITKTCTVFGQIYFADSETQYYDNNAGAYKPLAVKRGTLLIDPNVYFMRTVGSLNNTVIHECVHWEKHKRFFDLEKLFNKDAKSISCQVNEGTRPENARTPLDWIEWQANALAPRILMPAKQARQKIEELIRQNKPAFDGDNTAELMKKVILQLSEFFDVSKQAAKIRMIDLGYTEAMGAYTYVDDRYISSYSFAQEALKSNQTFSIGTQDAIYEYAFNEEFKKLLDTGKYVYVDAHFCINDSKYIRRNENGYAELTEYARRHIDECCIVFDIKARRNDRYGAKNYKECVLFRDAASDTILEAKYSRSAQNRITEARAEELRKISAKAKATARVMRALPSTFSDTLVAHMKRLDITVEHLAEESLISAKTIQRIRTSDAYDAKLETVVAVCIGLKLDPILSMDMVKKAGLAFKIDETHIIYQMLLHSYHQNSIHECNEILKANNCKPLGREE